MKLCKYLLVSYKASNVSMQSSITLLRSLYRVCTKLYHILLRPIHTSPARGLGLGRAIHFSPAPAPAYWWLWKIPNQPDFDFASKNDCASQYQCTMPIHWHLSCHSLLQARIARATLQCDSLQTHSASLPLRKRMWPDANIEADDYGTCLLSKFL